MRWRIKLHMEDRQKAEPQTQPIVGIVDPLLRVTRARDFNTRFRDQGLARSVSSGSGLLLAASLTGSGHLFRTSTASQRPSQSLHSTVRKNLFRYFSAHWQPHEPAPKLTTDSQLVKTCRRAQQADRAVVVDVQKEPLPV